MKSLLILCAVVSVVVVNCGPAAAPPTDTPLPPTAAPTVAPTEPPTIAPTATTVPTEAPTEAGATAAPTDAAPATDTAVPATATPAPTDTPAASPTPAVAYMTFQDFEIVPKALTIKAGTKVVFLIKAGLLTYHQPYSSFPDNDSESGLFSAPSGLGDGTSYAVTLTQPGTITVRCGYHSKDMVATITVTP